MIYVTLLINPIKRSPFGYESWICLFEKSNYKGKKYEIVLDGWNSTKCAIGRDNRSWKITKKKRVLTNKSGDYRAITVAVTKEGKVLVSEGEIPTKNVFMEWKDPHPFKVKYFGLLLKAKWKLNPLSP